MIDNNMIKKDNMLENECFCKKLDYVKVCELYNECSLKNLALTDKNNELQTKLDASQNVINHLSRELKNIVSIHENYKSDLQKQMVDLKGLNSAQNINLKKIEAELSQEFKSKLSLQKSVKQLNYLLEKEKKK